MSDLLTSTGDYVREHRLQCVGSLWAAGIASTFAFQFSRPIPFQLKVIHSCEPAALG
jgi:hypothetical protein